MYKAHPLGEGVIVIETGTCIPEDPRNVDWIKYQQWLAKGNTVAPSRTRAELQVYVEELIEEEAGRRIDAVTSANPREKRKTLARAIKLIRREVKGKASVEEIFELDVQEAIADYIDVIEEFAYSNIGWTKSEAPTNEKLEAFNPGTDIDWPTPPEG